MGFQYWGEHFLPKVQKTRHQIKAQCGFRTANEQIPFKKVRKDSNGVWEQISIVHPLLWRKPNKLTSYITETTVRSNLYDQQLTTF